MTQEKDAPLVSASAFFGGKEIRGKIEMLKEYPKRGDLLSVVRNLPEIEEIWQIFKNSTGLIGRMWGTGSELDGSSIPLICRSGAIIIRQIDAKGPLEVIIFRDPNRVSPDFEEVVERVWEIIRQYDFPYLEPNNS